MDNKVALITGAGKRVGAVIATTLHQAGMRVAIHYRHSQPLAKALCQRLNTLRSHSAITIAADLNAIETLPTLIEQVIAAFGQLDLLVNNASSFYPTTLGKTTVAMWQQLFASNAMAPFFLSQAACPYLKKSHGQIINMVDIHANTPLKNFCLYCMAKASLAMMTKSLAKDLAPQVRVNAIAPGMIMWPDQSNEIDENTKHNIINKIALKRGGKPQNVADTVLFLVQNDYITGQIIAVDGGRLLNI